MSSMSMKRSKHLRFSVAARCLCFAGLSLAMIPATASASPLAVQAPSLTSIVGLGQGAQGKEVKTVQTALLAAGVKVPGGADGNFGPATTSAVVAFQARKGLPPTGSIDEGTAVALGLARPAAATTPASSSAGGLTVGAQGPTVTELQQALMAAGVFVAGGADGVFGKGTTTAVSNYQRWNALAVTGTVDATTSSRLKLGTGAAPATPAAAPAVAPAAASNPTFSGMTVGARGDNVKVLQRALIAAGSSVRGGADGVFGAMTASALRAYQQAKGLSATGLVDDATIAGLALSPAAPTPAAGPTPAPAPNPVAGLKLGAMGDSVKQLQRALMNTGLVLRGGADGSFGNATNSALMAFQKTNGTAQTGVLTEQEANVLGLGSGGGAAAPQGISGPSGFAIYGERGDRVTAVQKSLIAAGLSFSGGADGMFGAATTNAIMEFQRRSGLAATGKLDDATAAKLGAVAAPAPAAPSSAGVAMDVFPMQGQCWFGDTWQAPRSGGRLHEGTDVIGPKGKLLYAVVSGTISKQYFDRPGSPAGNGVRVQQDNGTYFTYLHMDTFADGIAVGTTVTAGQVIGTVGATGAASPHLHFEVHPNGGGAVNPYPLLKAIDACNVSAPRS